jgi:hypothetical protein
MRIGLTSNPEEYYINYAGFDPSKDYPVVAKQKIPRQKSVIETKQISEAILNS